MNTGHQKLLGVGALVIAGVLAAGAAQIHGAAGYSGVGPGFVPWVVAGAMALCGVLLLVQAFSGGLRDLPAPPAMPPYWRGMAWVTAGLLLNAALITYVGFIPSCALLFALAARGFRLSMDQPVRGVTSLLRDAAIGVAISAPVFWLFTKLLGLNLPGLTHTGWL
ncbi:tripartite tricarboxylate transporter TctB family protein [Ideonella sp. BN130291]|uniref:tripartite tricarboxylate transporter TctB family protein n=1 Tax=Ideonella sp. BN130291 TaxID=3112940 RepID=UPI002E273519|nr:tripartite tricarboxylate transporter TctB family protein [Ideonella sp. BN130291]